MTGKLTLSARVGYRWRVTFSLDPETITAGKVLELVVDWSPKVPRRLSTQELAHYFAARNAFTAELARVVGGKTLAVDLDLGRVTRIDSANSVVGPRQ
jgi:hypothetical protein